MQTNDTYLVGAGRKYTLKEAIEQCESVIEYFFKVGIDIPGELNPYTVDEPLLELEDLVVADVELEGGDNDDGSFVNISNLSYVEEPEQTEFHKPLNQTQGDHLPDNSVDDLKMVLESPCNYEADEFEYSGWKAIPAVLLK